MSTAVAHRDEQGTRHAQAGSSVDPTARDVARAGRGPVVVGLVVVLAAVVLAILGSRPEGEPLDPRSPTPAGSRAVAEVLGDLGVRTARVTTTAAALRAVTAAGGAATVLVTNPDLLADSQVRRLLDSGADLVVLAPSDPGRFAAAVGRADTGAAAPEVRQPGCRLPAARRAGAADAGGAGWVVDADAAGGDRALLCYAGDGVPSLVRVTIAGQAVTVVGNPAPFTNERLDDEGNAALTFGLLGGHEQLVWYLPSLRDVPPAAAQTSFYDLVPDGVWWALAQLGVAVVLLALWRARRLGPVVAEPLPAVVRAAEATEGRARLYRRAGARDRAAEALRSAVRVRLATALGLPGRHEPAALVDAVADRSARPPGEVAALLYGAEPVDDPSLVRLADELDALDREVRRP